MAAPLPEGRRAAPAVLLFVARGVYAYNWYNVGAVLPLIGSSFGAGPGELGVVLGAFLLGVGVFQIPAGFAAVRYGARGVCLAGLTVLGAAGVASAFAPDWQWLALARGIGGVGAAFFFSPALALIASYFPAERRGAVIGFYNGGFSLGGAIGLFGGAAVGIAFGWPVALAVGGVALLGATAVAYVGLPKEVAPPPAVSLTALWRTGRGVVFSRSIWALSLALLGFWSAIYIVAQDFVEYAALDRVAWGTAAAATAVGACVLASLPGGPLGGWIADRWRHLRLLATGFALATAACVAAIPFLSATALIADLLALGVLDGIVFAVLYLVPTELPESRGVALSLGVGVVNSIQVGLGSGVAILFGFAAASYGYPTAWLGLAVFTLATLPLLAFVADRSERPGPGRSPDSSGGLPRDSRP